MGGPTLPMHVSETTLVIRKQELLDRLWSDEVRGYVTIDGTTAEDWEIGWIAFDRDNPIVRLSLKRKADEPEDPPAQESRE